MTSRTGIWFLSCALCLLPGCFDSDEGTDPHAGHDHGEEGQDDHDDHGDEEKAKLTAEQRERVGLRTAVAEHGTIVSTASFPGELALDPDRIVHVVPPAGGFVRGTKVTIGEEVEPGQVLALIESSELAEAKMAYFSALAQMGIAGINLPRNHTIYEGVNQLLDLLKTGADSATLAGLAGIEMGQWRGQLLTAYSEYQATRAVFESEKRLRAKDISSERELVEAEAAYLKAQAELNASRDIARYEVQIGLIDAVQALQVAEFEAVAAEKKLRLLGAGDAVIEEIQALLPDAGVMVPCGCNDQECQHHGIASVYDSLGREQNLGWYTLKAPIAGKVISKHMTLGERVGNDVEVFSIVDTDTLWLQFNIYQKDLPSIREELPVRVVIGPGYEQRSGTIQSISPLIDEETRTVKARVVLDNADGVLRPGLFVTIHVETDRVQASVVIPKDAVQILDEREVVFVEDGDGFTAEPVVLGRSDKRSVEVLSGLEPGTRFVTHGAFELKAMIVTSGLDAHAGHGH